MPAASRTAAITRNASANGWGSAHPLFGPTCDDSGQIIWIDGKIVIAFAVFLNFVKSGKGLIAIHAAADNFYKWPEGVEMIGGEFTGHPWLAKGTWAYKVEEPKHPLNKGWSSPKFAFSDEIYQFGPPYSRDKLRVLVSIDRSDPRNQKGVMKKVKRTDEDFAISWIHPFGNGRVFYCGFGHRVEIFWNKDVLQHYLAGIQYALGDLAAPDAPRKQ